MKASRQGSAGLSVVVRRQLACSAVTPEPLPTRHAVALSGCTAQPSCVGSGGRVFDPVRVGRLDVGISDEFGGLRFAVPDTTILPLPWWIGAVDRGWALRGPMTDFGEPSSRSSGRTRRDFGAVDPFQCL